MLIGKNYSDNKIYRGIRNYDGLPISSEDLHEYSDTAQRKAAFFLNSLVGSGTINEPSCRISSTGISLESPSVVLIDGDIALVQSDESPLVPIELVANSSSNGLVCIVGWYQHLTHSSTLRSYGGVNNTVIENDLVDKELGIQLSTRYQLRWDIITLDATEYSSGASINFDILSRDANGDSLGEYISLTIPASEKSVRIVPKPESMSYAESDLYIVPILQYTYSDSTISDARACRPLQAMSGGKFYNREIEPSGEHVEGDIWYVPSTQTFKFYIEGLGFVPITSHPRLVRYTNKFTFSESAISSSDITLDIGISLYNASSTLDVYYEGLLLYPSIDYTVDIQNNRIKLLNFTTVAGESVTFVVTSIVDDSV